LKQFVHLRLHTEYSLVDGIVRVPELMAAVAASGMPAVALTDQSNLFAMVKFYKEALAAGVKPLIGVDAWIREVGERAPPSRAVFLCQNLVGYRHLTQLVTRSYLEGQRRGAPMLERGWLQSDVLKGLIVVVELPGANTVLLTRMQHLHFAVLRVPLPHQRIQGAIEMRISVERIGAYD